MTYEDRQWLDQMERQERQTREAEREAVIRAEADRAFTERIGPAYRAAEEAHGAAVPMALRVQIAHAMRLAAEAPAVDVRWFHKGSMVATTMLQNENGAALAYTRRGVIVVPAIRSQREVLTCLHEIGHIRDEVGGRPFPCEVHAWAFAAKHALQWGDADTDEVVRCLTVNAKERSTTSLEVLEGQSLIERLRAMNRRVTSEQIRTYRADEYARLHGSHACGGTWGCTGRPVGSWRAYHVCASCLDGFEMDESLKRMKAERAASVVAEARPGRYRGRLRVASHSGGLVVVSDAPGGYGTTCAADRSADAIVAAFGLAVDSPIQREGVPVTFTVALIDGVRVAEGIETKDHPPVPDVLLQNARLDVLVAELKAARNARRV